MNQLMKFTRPIQWLSATLFFLLVSPVMADGVVVVQGKSNGYLYDLSSNRIRAGKEISLTVAKEGQFKEYLIESADGAFRCDESCPEASLRVPAGSTTLLIVGKKPVSFLNIPLTGTWSSPCTNTHTETAECTFSLNELNSRVSVAVNPDIEPGMTFPLPEGGEGMIITVDTRDGYILIANHENLGAKTTWLAFNPDWKSRLNINSPTDGRLNTEKLMEIQPPSPAATYCQNMGSNWYLPARKELELLTKDALKKIPGLDEESRLWSSTEENLVQGTNNGVPYLELRVHTLANNTATITRGYSYSYDLKDGKWKEDAKYTGRYQVLCFRRLPI